MLGAERTSWRNNQINMVLTQKSIEKFSVLCSCTNKKAFGGEPYVETPLTFWRRVNCNIKENQNYLKLIAFLTLRQNEARRKKGHL